jgi:hypothetical protein
LPDVLGSIAQQKFVTDFSAPAQYFNQLGNKLYQPCICLCPTAVEGAGSTQRRQGQRTDPAIAPVATLTLDRFRVRRVAQGWQEAVQPGTKSPMIVRKAFKYRIDPNKKQQAALAGVWPNSRQRRSSADPRALSANKRCIACSVADQNSKFCPQH